jgi:A/G-specific adenine glycosylase
VSDLARWYVAHGRHELPWRALDARHDRWAVLVSEVMLAQTQVGRVVPAWAAFLAEFPGPDALAKAGPAAALRAWGRLGYPRRARRLWEASVAIARDGWPRDYASLPGVGRYTAGAIAAQADERADAVAVDVNIRRVVQRVEGRILGATGAEAAAIVHAAPLTGRDRLLALMDLGALVCTPRAPRCDECPLHDSCSTRGPLDGERARPAARYEGSHRQRRGVVLARLRAADSVAREDLDPDALASLLADGLAELDASSGRVSLPHA